MKKLTKEYLINSPATSYWLKDAIKILDDRDPVDALNDITILQVYLKDKLDTIKNKNI